jgi:hypothetical protein
LGYKEHLKEQQNQRKAAGKKSAVARAERAAERRRFVKIAFFNRLTSLERMYPNSANSMRRLQAAYGRQLIEAGFDPTGPPFKVSRETLRSDLKRLGIRSWLRSNK